MKKKKIRVKLEHFQQLLPVEGGYEIEHRQATGRVAIPEYAGWVWSLESGPSWNWNQENHFKDDSCVVCATGPSCTQHVTVWARSQTIMVVHDYHPTLPC